MGNGLGLGTGRFGCCRDEGLWWGRRVEARRAVRGRSKIEASPWALLTLFLACVSGRG